MTDKELVFLFSLYLPQEHNSSWQLNAVDFLKDGLFCEFAYFIDFETQKLGTWKAGEMIDVATFSKVTQDGDSYMAELENRTHEEEEEEEED